MAGHKAELISARLVATVRQNQKTDKNDALAIDQAAQLPEINFIKGKNIEQQQLQSVLRLRELAIKQKTVLSNQIKGFCSSLTSEFIAKMVALLQALKPILKMC